MQNLKTLKEGILSGDRRALAKAISLAESSLQNDQALSEALLKSLKKPKNPSLRFAVSGPPGVGKSTFINKFASLLSSRGRKIAILPIDPSSELTKGSLLADKTRMGDLITSDQIFIRPSASKGVFGGISSATYDVILLMEAFGFDTIIIETVGIGQSESLAYSLVDHFLLLMQPASGDALQAMKKGVLERADMVAVSKADGELKALAQASFKTLKSSLKVPVFLVSSIDGFGLEKLENELLVKHQKMIEQNLLIKNRQEKISGFISFVLKEKLAEKIEQEGDLKTDINELSSKIIKQGALLNKGVEEILCKKIKFNK